jgi:hypothetical protein
MKTESGHDVPEQSRVLQFAIIDLLLVRCLTGCMGRTESGWGLLVSSPWCVSRHDPVGRGAGLLCQLGKESHVSLRNHRPGAFDRWRRVSTAGRGQCPAEHVVGLAFRRHRNWRGVPAGMARCQAPLFDAVTMRRALRWCAQKGAPTRTSLPRFVYTKTKSQCKTGRTPMADG